MNVAKKLILFTSIFLLSFLFFGTTTADALSFKQVGETDGLYKIEVLANPPTEVDSIQIRLGIEQAEIVDFALSTQTNYLSVGACANNKYFTTNTVCFDVSTINEKVKKGDVLATLFLDPLNNPNNVTIRKSSNNGYLGDSLELIPDIGTTKPLATMQTVNLSSSVFIGFAVLTISIVLIALISAFLTSRYISQSHKKDLTISKPSHSRKIDYMKFSGYFLLFISALGVLLLISYLSRQSVQTPNESFADISKTITVCENEGNLCDYVGIQGLRSAIYEAKNDTSIHTILIEQGVYKYTSDIELETYTPLNDPALKRTALFVIDLYTNGVRNDSHPLNIVGVATPGVGSNEVIFQGADYIEDGGSTKTKGCEQPENNPCVNGEIIASSGFVVRSGVVNFENIHLRGFTQFDAEEFDIDTDAENYYLSWGSAIQVVGPETPPAGPNQSPAGIVTVVESTLDHNTYGIRTFGDAHVNVKNNIIANNKMNMHFGDNTTSDTITDNYIASGRTGGIYISSNASLKSISFNEFTDSLGANSAVTLEGEALVEKIENNTFRKNNAVALNIRAESIAKEISNNHFDTNGTGIIIHTKATSLGDLQVLPQINILKNTFDGEILPSDPEYIQDNLSNGILVRENGPIVSIIGNRFSDLRLNGLSIESGSVENIENNIFYDINSSQSSVGNINTYGNAINMSLFGTSTRGPQIGDLVNNTFVDNKYGLLIRGYSEDSDENKARVGHFRNNIFSNNDFGEPSSRGAAIGIRNDFVKLADNTFSLFYKNGDGQDDCKKIENATTLYNCQGDGNIFNLDPLFLDYENGDLRLMKSQTDESPALDSGRDDNNKPTDIGAYGGEFACLLDEELPDCITATITPSPTLQPTKGVTITPTPTPTTETVVCGAADVNGDGDFSIVDFSQFASFYLKKCSDVDPVTGEPLDIYGACGGKDSVRGASENSPYGIISILDLRSFAGRYNNPTCTL